MSGRFQAKEGLYNIECAFCGCKVKNNQTHLTKLTKQAICNWHSYDENYERPGPIVPIEAQPLRPQKIPTETYDAAIGLTWNAFRGQWGQQTEAWGDK